MINTLFQYLHFLFETCSKSSVYSNQSFTLSNTIHNQIKRCKFAIIDSGFTMFAAKAICLGCLHIKNAKEKQIPSPIFEITHTSWSKSKWKPRKELERKRKNMENGWTCISLAPPNEANISVARQCSVRIGWDLERDLKTPDLSLSQLVCPGDLNYYRSCRLEPLGKASPRKSLYAFPCLESKILRRAEKKSFDIF